MSRDTIYTLPDSDQLELGLHPWDGRSPRYLTQCHLSRTIGGTGRALLRSSEAPKEQTDQREDLQLWLFEDGVI